MLRSATKTGWHGRGHPSTCYKFQYPASDLGRGFSIGKSEKMTSDLLRFSRPFVLVAVTAVAGCTGSTDPTTATLFDNIANLNSGEYDRQIANNKAQADAIIAQNKAAEQRNAQLAAQSNANKAEIDSLRRQIADVKAQGAKARAASASDPVKLQQVQALDNQLNAVERDVNSGASSAAISSELNRIKSAYRALSI